MVLAACLVGCADPRLPTGGPPDKTPPDLEHTEPAHETTDFSGDRVRLEFTEFVNENSLQRAFSMTPEPRGRIRFRWRKRRVDVVFPEPLQRNTTYVITLGNDLRDAHGVALPRPLTLAFATGPVIDRGGLGGRVLTPREGAPAVGFDIFAWSLPDSTAPHWLSARPDYRTQTDDAGRFTLTHLREEAYFVAALQDRNRNLRPDAGEPFAAPPAAAIRARADTAEVTRPWIVARADTARPAVQRVRALSETRLQVRFSEPVVLSARNPAAWSLADSASGAAAEVAAVYRAPGNVRDVVLRTQPLAKGIWAVRPDGSVRDSSGNPVHSGPHFFASSAAADTAGLRLLEFLPRALGPERRLSPRDRAAVVLSEPPPDSLAGALISVRDTVGQSLAAEARTTDGTTYALVVDAAPGGVFDVIVHLPDSARSARYRTLSDRELGSVSGSALAEDSTLHVVVELYGTELLAASLADSAGAFTFEGLPEGSYALRVVGDRNGNGRWDGGRLFPYEAAEPLTWSEEPSEVRARWDTALADTLYISRR